jgi:hypothetical protein
LAQQHASWNAAFATVLLGGIITLLWHGQEIPDAAPDRQAPSVASVPASMPTSKAAEVSEAHAITQPSQLAKAAPVQSKPKLPEVGRNSEQINAAQPTPPATEAKAIDQPADAVTVAPSASPAAAPAAAPAMMMRRAANDAISPTEISATLLMNGRTSPLSLTQSATLTQALSRLLQRSNQVTQATPTEPAALRLTITHPTGQQSIWELWPEVLRWQASGQEAQLRRVEELSTQALLAEAARLMPP